MTLFKTTFQFVAGTVVGIYVAQNYNVPNIEKLAKTFFILGKHIEETYRKPKEERGTDDIES